MEGPKTTYTYDLHNRVTSERYAQANGSDGGRVREFQYKYGAQGALVSHVSIDRESAAVTGPESNDAGHARYRVTSESFKAAGKLLSASTNGILVERHTYDAFGQLRTDELQAGNAVLYEYDRTGHVTSVTHASVEVWPSPSMTDTFDRYDVTIGGTTWHVNDVCFLKSLSAKQ